MHRTCIYNKGWISDELKHMTTVTAGKCHDYSGEKDALLSRLYADGPIHH